MSPDAKLTSGKQTIKWLFWRLQRYVIDWQAAALSLGIDPDAMHHHPQAWMADSSKAIFEKRSFSDAMQESEFDKRYRLAETWAKERGDKVRYFNTRELELSGFAAWLVDNDVEVPSEFRNLANQTEAAVTVPSESTSAEQQLANEVESQDINGALAGLFDPVGTAALEKMFPTNPTNPTNTKWKKWSERAASNGLEMARVGRAKFNPFLAARWWLEKQNPSGWDWAACKRRLAGNLPSRSRDSRNLLTDDL